MKKSLFNDPKVWVLGFCAMFLLAHVIIMFTLFVSNYREVRDAIWVIWILCVVGAGGLMGLWRIIELFHHLNTFLEEDDNNNNSSV
jgi:hypothetical protein